MEIFIIGKGPAGISAAIYALRNGANVTVVGKDFGALKKAEKIENYYGFKKPLSGKKLAENGIVQAQTLGAKMLDDEVVGFEFLDKLYVKTTKGSYSADKIIIATGIARLAPKIENFQKFEGKGISFCATCDAFFYKHKTVAVLGSGEYALSEYNELKAIANKVYLLTNGEKVSANFSDAQIIDKKITALSGSDRLNQVIFNDYSIDIDGLFVAIGSASSTDLAKKIGILTENNKIIINENMQTNIPDIYAVGDCTGAPYQIAKAVYQGMIAGLHASKR